MCSMLLNNGSKALNPVPENLHGRLSVGVVGWFETQLLQAEPVKEQFERADQVPQRQALVTDHTCTVSLPCHMVVGPAAKCVFILLVFFGFHCLSKVLGFNSLQKEDKHAAVRHRSWAI